MNVLLLGSGGREHALAWKLQQSPLLSNLYVAPGNAGTSAVATNVNLSVSDFKGIKDFVLDKDINMVVVGPEDPLVNGIHDFFLNSPGLETKPVIGPCKEGAALEGSKEFAKKFMMRHQIPTAAYASFTSKNIEEGNQFLDTLDPPYVLKADGLAAGKGVIITNNLQEAKSSLFEMIHESKFGKAGNTVVIEEFLSGIELSVFAISDGESYKILPSAKDYKRIGEGDTGLNTGGMGAISPVPFGDSSFMKKVEEQIVAPTFSGLQKEGIAYSGFLFFGLIKVNDNPYVIEYNVRMGDPETEVVVPRIESDLLDLFHGIATKTLNEKEIKIKKDAAVTVMLVAGGYPESYEKGEMINGLDLVETSIVFHAGTKNENGSVITNGGRVIAITSYGEDMKSALKKSYANADKIQFTDKYYRKDIGFDLA